MPWIDHYSKEGAHYYASSSVQHSTRRMARVKSYGDVLREYEYHPEAKCADPDGKPCGKQTLGLLQRRYIAVDGFDYIGKESNKIEQGGVPAESDVYTIYSDPRWDEWEIKWLPIVRATPVPQLLEHGVSRAAIYAARAGRQLCRNTKPKLVAALRRQSKN